MAREMRVVPVAASAGLVLALVAGGASITAVAAGRQSSFSGRAAALERVWTRDLAVGVPVSSITPLRRQLQRSQDLSASWWSPHWWGDTGQALLDQLQKQTNTAWSSAMSVARAKAQVAVAGWTQLSTQLGSFIPASASAEAATWPARLMSATTPDELIRLAQLWGTETGTARSQAQTAQRNAQKAQLNAQVAGYGGVAGLLRAAQGAVSTARGDNLDAGQVPSLIASAQSQFQSGGDATTTLKQLVAAYQGLRSLISLNDNVASLQQPLLWTIDQAAAESTPNAGGLQAQYATLQNAFRNASEAPQLTTVQQQMNALTATVNQELAANQCGHGVGGGKVITLNLTLQEAVFYQDGCAVRGTPITTGRALLRTPTGRFHIFYKTSPFRFVSPWPPSSPFYYYPSWTSWVMEFASGGYFIHDAPWEPAGEYGPGSENSSGASHGCVHIQTPTMQWVYQWTPIGTPVIITN